jgi:hypothetical protein
MSLLKKLALGSIAAFALFRAKGKSRVATVAAPEATTTDATTPAKRARRKAAKKRRAPARRVKIA